MNATTYLVLNYPLLKDFLMPLHRFVQFRLGRSHLDALK